MWKAGKYQPGAKSSLLTNYHLLKFRYSAVDDVPETPDLVEGRPFAILVIQAISRHLPQLRCDFEASIPRGQRELSCNEFVAFMLHYLKYREHATCPTFAPRSRYEAELRRQAIAQAGPYAASLLFQMPAEVPSAAEVNCDPTTDTLDDEKRLQSNSVDEPTSAERDGLGNSSEPPAVSAEDATGSGGATKSAQRKRGPAAVTFDALPHEASLAATMDDTMQEVVSDDDGVVVPHNGDTCSTNETPTHEPSEDDDEKEVRVLRPRGESMVGFRHLRDELHAAQDVDDVDIALKTLKRMETTGPHILRDQLVRLYRAIDVEDSDGVCWTEFSNFLSDIILQSSDDAEGGGGSAAHHTTLEEDSPFELNPFVCDRVDHMNAIQTVKGVDLGVNEVTGASEGLWLVQSRISADAANATGQQKKGVSGGAAATPSADSSGKANFKCTFELHNVRKPQNDAGNLLSHSGQFLRNVLEENVVQSEWVPMHDVVTNDAVNDETEHDDIPDGATSGLVSASTAARSGVSTIGLVVYSSTDLRLRLCEYRLQTGVMTPLAAVHAAEAFCTMAWSSYWKRLFCCSNSGTMSVWKVQHPTEIQRRARAEKFRGNLSATPLLEREQLFHEHRSTISKVLFLPLDGSVATASLDPRLIVQDLDTGAVVADLKGSQAGIRDADYNVEYHMIAACGYEQHVRLWVLHESTRSNSIVLSDRGHSSSTAAQHNLPIIGVHFFPSTPYLASADSNGLVRIWDLRTLRVVQNIDLDLKKYPGHPREKSIQQLSVMGGTNVLLSSRRLSFLVHPLGESTASLRRSEADTIVAMGMSFSASSIVTITAGAMQLWDLRTGSITSTFHTAVSTKEEEATALALDTQGRKIIVGFRGGKVRVYSSVNGAVLKTIVVSRSQGTEIMDLKTLVSGGQCISVDSANNVCCFSDRDEGVQFAYLELGGYRGEQPLFTSPSRMFPFLAVAHSRLLVSIFEISALVGLAPSFHSYFRLTSLASVASPVAAEKPADIHAKRASLAGSETCEVAPLAGKPRRNAVTESAVSVALSVDIVAMEFADAWRILAVLDSVGVLHLLQIGPTKERGVRCTHHLRILRPAAPHAAGGSISPLRRQSTQVSLQASLGESTLLSSSQNVAVWTPSCMQFLCHGTRQELLLCHRNGETVAIHCERLQPPQRKARFYFEHDALWATSVKLGAPTSLENSVSSRQATPRAVLATTPRLDDDEYDWADDLIVSITRHASQASREIAALPKPLGSDRGPVSGLLVVVSFGMCCLLPSGSRSLYVTTMDGQRLVGELSLDKKPSPTGLAAAGYLGLSVDPIALQQQMEYAPLEDLDTALELDLRPVGDSSATGSVSSPTNTGGGASVNISAAVHNAVAQLRRRSTSTTTALKPVGLPPRSSILSLTDEEPQDAGEAISSIALSTVALASRSSRRSVLQARSLPVSSMMRARTPELFETARAVGDARCPSSLASQSAMISSSKSLNTAPHEASFRVGQQRASTPSAAPRHTSSPAAVLPVVYSRYVRPGTPEASPYAPSLTHDDALTQKQPGFSGVLLNVHPLAQQHQKLVTETLHMVSGADLAKGAALPPHMPLRATTPAPVSHGIRACGLTTAGWRQSAVEVRPKSGRAGVLPAMRSPSVPLRCNITPVKKKDPTCVAQDRPSSSMIAQALCVKEFVHISSTTKL